MLGALQHILTSLGFHEDISVFIVLYGLVFARLVTAITLTPFLGGKSVSSQVKVGLAAVISAIIFPILSPRANPSDLNTLRVMGLLVKESVIGLTIGYLSQIIFQSYPDGRRNHGLRARHEPGDVPRSAT